MEQKKKILIVDDYDEARKLLTVYIQRFGYEPLKATDGLEALEQAQSNHPDLILMDLLMPRMDGEESIAKLKANPATKDIPIIVLTASSRAAESISTRCSGVSGVLIKPIDFTELRTIMARYLSGPAANGADPISTPSDGQSTFDRNR